MTKDALIKRLRDAGVIYREPVILRSGKTSEFYCDIKKGFGHPDILNALADEIAALLPNNVTCIAASGYGGLPLGAVIASRCDKKFIAVRGAEKNHGKGGLIDGYVPGEGDTIAIVDDVLTTGSSIKETLRGLKGSNATIACAIVAVRRGEVELPFPVSHIFTIEEIVGK